MVALPETRLFLFFWMIYAWHCILTRGMFISGRSSRAGPISLIHLAFLNYSYPSGNIEQCLEHSDYAINARQMSDKEMKSEIISHLEKRGKCIFDHNKHNLRATTCNTQEEHSVRFHICLRYCPLVCLRKHPFSELQCIDLKNELKIQAASKLDYNVFLKTKVINWNVLLMETIL